MLQYDCLELPKSKLYVFLSMLQYDFLELSKSKLYETSSKASQWVKMSVTLGHFDI